MCVADGGMCVSLMVVSLAVVCVCVFCWWWHVCVADGGMCVCVCIADSGTCVCVYVCGCRTKHSEPSRTGTNRLPSVRLIFTTTYRYRHMVYLSLFA